MLSTWFLNNAPHSESLESYMSPCRNPTVPLTQVSTELFSVRVTSFLLQSVVCRREWQLTNMEEEDSKGS